jgi:prolipoprotein diacylglyceryltransferase
MNVKSRNMLYRLQYGLVKFYVERYNIDDRHEMAQSSVSFLYFSVMILIGIHLFFIVNTNLAVI